VSHPLATAALGLGAFLVTLGVVLARQSRAPAEAVRPTVSAAPAGATARATVVSYPTVAAVASAPVPAVASAPVPAVAPAAGVTAPSPATLMSPAAVATLPSPSVPAPAAEPPAALDPPPVPVNTAEFLANPDRAARHSARSH